MACAVSTIVSSYLFGSHHADLCGFCLAVISLIRMVIVVINVVIYVVIYGNS